MSCPLIFPNIHGSSLLCGFIGPSFAAVLQPCLAIHAITGVVPFFTISESSSCLIIIQLLRFLINFKLSGLASVCFTFFPATIINVSICFTVAETIADLCLFTSVSISLEGFRKASDFCLNAVPYLKPKSAVGSSIIDANVVLDILKENRDNYGLSLE